MTRSREKRNANRCYMPELPIPEETLQYARGINRGLRSNGMRSSDRSLIFRRVIRFEKRRYLVAMFHFMMQFTGRSCSDYR